MKLYNKLLEGAILPLGDLINRSKFIHQLKQWRKIQYFSKIELDLFQRKKLVELFNHVNHTIPYYKDFSIAKIDDPYEVLAEMPIIEKKDIKANLKTFLNPESKNLIEYASSGSSGIQGKVFMNKREQSIIRAILMLWWEWAGFRLGDPILQTGMTPNRGILKTIKDVLLRTRYYNAFGLEPSSIVKVLHKQSLQREFYLGGYASSLFLLAETAIDNGIEVEFQSAMSWGDKMFPHYRDSIFNAFNCKVYDSYACNEGIMIAAQKDLNYYYIMSPHVYLEIVDDNGSQVPDGQMGHVVVTQLDNYSMPLVRYRVGDLACKLPLEKYPEHRDLQFPLLEKIIGRDTDIVKTRSSKFMIVHFFTGIFEFFPTIKQFRVIQKSLDELSIEYIPDHGFVTGILDEIRNQIQDYLNEPFPIHFIKVDKIPPTKSGKPQIIQSFLQNSRLN